MLALNPSAAPMRRRALTFALAFFVAAAAGLAFVLTRPPEYRAMARITITPAAGVSEPDDTQHALPVATAGQSLLAEAQVLTSRPIVEQALARLRADNRLPPQGSDAAAAAQRMLAVEPIAGSNIVRLIATGPEREFVAPLANAVAHSFRQRLSSSYAVLSADTARAAAGEAKALADKIATQQAALDAFRQRYDIVSIERQENQVLADIQGLSKAYTEANDRLAKAQGRVDALKTGKTVVAAKDDPTLAALQQRAALMREEWQQLQQRFTPAYLALDPDATALRARLGSLEAQLQAATSAGQRAALIDAQQQLTAAATAVAELRKTVADNQKQAQEFAAHLNEYKAMRDDLDHLEAMRRAALDRLAKLQASAAERAPRLEVLEAAATPTRAWRPDYRLDAALALAGAIGFALFATWFVEFIAGPAWRPPVYVPYPWPTVLAGGEGPASGLLAVADRARLHGSDMARLASPEPPPRVLSEAEVTALFDAASEEAKLAVTALLTGIDAEELVALEWGDVDFDAALLHLRGAGARDLPLGEPLRTLLRRRRQHRPQPEAGGPVLTRPDGGAAAPEEIGRLILYAAYDAGLEQPDEVTAAALRHTYIAFLLQQGVRAADIEAIVGRIPQADLVAQMRLHSPSVRRPLAEIDRVFPALRHLADRTA